MKTRSQILLWTLAWLSMVIPISARGIGDIRIDARFLTDRMAFELNLNTNQYNDLYEVNYDFLSNVDPYLLDMVRQNPYALDCYYRYLDERNDDLKWILSNSEYIRFLTMDYFLRPVYVFNNLCRLRVYQRYPDRNRFYFNRPVHYMSYHGGHSRASWCGTSFYKRNFVSRYHHPVYKGDCRIRPEHRRGDFVRPSHPGKSEMRNKRPYAERYCPDNNNRTGVYSRDLGRNNVYKGQKKGYSQPVRPDKNRPSRGNGHHSNSNHSTFKWRDSSRGREYRDDYSVRPGKRRNYNHETHRHPVQSDSRFLREM